MIGVGIIGAGFAGEAHADAISEVDGVHLVAASRRDVEKLRAFCKAHNCVPYGDYHTLLADKRIDVVVVSTPHHLHTTIAIDAAASGKGILLEKPMAPSLAECDDILKAVAKYGVPFMVGFSSHYARSYMTAKGLLEAIGIAK